MKEIKKLRELGATAICGNDITSSCLYVSAITISYAGQYAWLALLIVSGVLFLFRKIYGEVVGALPLNGGAYNVLLNTTSKNNASIAACLTILSYMATAVISATEAMHYLHSLVNAVPVIPATIILLTIFLLLTISGIRESSFTATVIFIFHISTMLLLIITAVIFVMNNGFDIPIQNFKMPVKGGIATALFFGFSTAMLGISGFESSANFVEEQQKGVFPKTLRNMWAAVTIINPLMALSIILVLPLASMGENESALLSVLGASTGGKWLATLISVDATMVLSGAVLTSFVGVNGLMKRMTLDRVLPQFLLKNSTRSSAPWILVFFYLLCISILLITMGKIGPLAGVYTISFLLVMIYFGFGNFLLKIKRSRLPRPEYATPFAVAVAILAVAIAIYGNIKLHPEYLVIFLQYFIPAVIIVNLLLRRNNILQYLLVVIESFIDTIRNVAASSHARIEKILRRLISQQFVYFTKGDDISVINKVMIYVTENEITRKLKIVTVLKEGEKVTDEFLQDIKVIDRAYPQVDIEFVVIEGSFGPQLINKLSREWKIPVNFMFISSPGDKFPYKVSELGGVRVII
jgi:amino acid transporter